MGEGGRAGDPLAIGWLAEKAAAYIAEHASATAEVHGHRQ